MFLTLLPPLLRYGIPLGGGEGGCGHICDACYIIMNLALTLLRVKVYSLLPREVWCCSSRPCPICSSRLPRDPLQ